jgi:hypothetical protein
MIFIRCLVTSVDDLMGKKQDKFYKIFSLTILMFSVIQLIIGDQIIGFLGFGLSIVLLYIGIIKKPSKYGDPFDEALL